MLEAWGINILALLLKYVSNIYQLSQLSFAKATE